MARLINNRRVLRVGFVILLAICAAQVAWWMIDQWRYGHEVSNARVTQLEEDVELANWLAENGVPSDEIATRFPHLTFGFDTRFQIRDQVVAEVEDQERRRFGRYVWEGSFFLAVLMGGMGFVARAIREETILRRRQENFLASVGHEFKSPLAGIRLGIETLAMREMAPEARQRIFDRMLEEVHRLDSMVRNLLDTARIEEGRSRLIAEPIVLNEVVRTAVTSIEDRCRDAGVELDPGVDEDLIIHADRHAASAVLGNLLDNAIKATHRVENGKISIRSRTDEKFVILDVFDTGMGFPPEEGRHLFEKFYRPGDEMRRSGKGSGLGLYIVVNLMRLAGGGVEAESDGPGQGARFTVWWPKGTFDTNEEAGAVGAPVRSSR